MILKKLHKLILKNKRLLQGCFGFALLAIVIMKSHPRELYEQMLGAPLLYMIPLIIFYHFISITSWSLGIYSLIKRMKPGGIKQLISSSFKLQIFSIVAPGRIGDFALLYFLKDTYTYGQTSAVLLIDKLITLSVNITLASIGIGIFFSWGHSLTLISIMIAGFAILLWIIFKCPQNYFNIGIISRIIKKLEGFRVEINATVIDYKGIGINLALTVFRYILAGISVLLLLMIFGVNVSLVKIILIQAIIQLATFVPLTIMGIGVLEALCVYFFGMVGVASETILAIGLWGRAIYLGLIFSIYLFWIWKKQQNKPKSQVKAITL
ncbi:MAG: lysylphosphatidylglycerol synthase transmembrane domain-containing protein [Thermodesulfobacteriota bacterium]|nr:lysylphosphatidylglycerol synthase transmembrane domain-containing protein [Thermodesulfobacteriota bacterium]